jgi:uncharacterized protein DUF2252
MNIVKSTRKYEDWLRRHTSVLEPDLRLKHQRMKESIFMFLRATFYRWVQVWPEICSDFVAAPKVLAVGDLHVENFGTWRDVEGRLIWGVNDFDEAYEMPYTNDLVRLAVSVALAIQEKHLGISGKLACEAIMEGYQMSLKAGGQPYVLEEQNPWLRRIALGELRDPVHFWKRMDSLQPVKGRIPLTAAEALEHLLPEKGLTCKIVRRVAGSGSLGHQRLVVITEWRGGRIAREAKALVPSSCYWASEGDGSTEIMYQTIMSRAVRCLDPFVQLRGKWIIRRLSPHCCRLELDAMPADRDELKLLRAMGWETANIHLGTPNAARAILRHLGKQSAGWLHKAAKEMAKVVETDWRAWTKSGT